MRLAVSSAAKGPSGVGHRERSYLTRALLCATTWQWTRIRCARYAWTWCPVACLGVDATPQVLDAHAWNPCGNLGSTCVAGLVVRGIGRATGHRALQRFFQG